MKIRLRKLIKKRNSAIYAMYVKLWGQGLREELIWPQISEVFYLEEETIYRIVLDQNKQEQLKKQTKLFPEDEDQ